MLCPVESCWVVFRQGRRGFVVIVRRVRHGSSGQFVAGTALPGGFCSGSARLGRGRLSVGGQSKAGESRRGGACYVLFQPVSVRHSNSRPAWSCDDGKSAPVAGGVGPGKAGRWGCVVTLRIKFERVRSQRCKAGMARSGMSS